MDSKSGLQSYKKKKLWVTYKTNKMQPYTKHGNLEYLRMMWYEQM